MSVPVGTRRDNRLRTGTVYIKETDNVPIIPKWRSPINLFKDKSQSHNPVLEKEGAGYSLLQG
jgi:hypothetical protein